MQRMGAWWVGAVVIGVVVSLSVSGCQREKPKSAPPVAVIATPPLLAREAVAQRVEGRIKDNVPGVQITRTSSATMALVFPDGLKAQIALDTAFAICGRRPDECNDYVDKLVETIRKDDEDDEGEETE